MKTRRRVEVQGIVQGVGFRPFVFRLAAELNLAGFVANTAAGVTIEIEGEAAALAAFLCRLPLEMPPLARLKRTAAWLIEPIGECDFRILPSECGAPAEAMVAPDVATCADCLRELIDPADRRFGYPFLNCTNCGPRFTIVRSVPYDRAATSMACFPMCELCQAEYDDPRNRRFHAQPNACWRCGPRAELWNADGALIEVADPLAAAAAAIARGEIVAVKGLGGFHLAVNAAAADAVRRLRMRKGRAEKPFAVMVRDVAVAQTAGELDEAAYRALTSVERPIVLVRRRQSRLASQVAPGNRYLGLFLPYTPIHHLLFAHSGLEAIVMTSANLSEEPIAIDNREAVARLRGIADCYLVHNRDILRRADDSVVAATGGGLRHLRRSRGYVPAPVTLRSRLTPVLAVGGELKNTICLLRGEHAFLSQHVGDLENYEACRFFEDAIAHLRNVLEFTPEIVAHDLHPDYYSTRWALRQAGVRRVAVQHHHAHIASCMAEHQLDGPVIGFAMDGAGYGTDGNIWGGEMLVCDYTGFERAAHFEYMPMPGGEAAIREPWRMAVSYLAHHFGAEFVNRDLPFLRGIEAHKLPAVLQMIERRVNSPLTSSCGRLFDAVAALAGTRNSVTYEAQAAIEMEMAIEHSEGEEPYPFDVHQPEGEPWLIGTRPTFERLLADMRCGASTAAISVRFHLGLVEVFARVAQLLRERTGLNRVCLGGGTFQNRFLLERLQTRLCGEGFAVYANAQVPSGDGGLSLGQAAVAGHSDHR